MGYPDWKAFAYIFGAKSNDAFEALARNLFKKRYGIGDTLSYFKNHPGNETDVIKVGKEIIGFQAKYFDSAINAKDLIDSIETARRRNPDQTIQVIYTNQAFGIPGKDKDTGELKALTDKQKHIEDVAANVHLKLEWIYGDNITDEVMKDDVLTKVFFDAESNLRDLDKDLARINEIRLNRIQTGIKVKGHEHQVDRTVFKQTLQDALMQHHVILTGKSGTGKSALVKNFLEEQGTTLTYLWLNAHQLATSNVDTLFGFERQYTLKDFGQFYANDANKILVIDSAEELVEIADRDVTSLLLKVLVGNGWKVVFTTREYAANDLKGLAEEVLSLSVKEIIIPALKTEEVGQFLQTQNLPIPSNQHLLNRIKTLFFLARYVEVAGNGDEKMLLRDFRSKIWELKIKGGIHERPTLRKDRETCLVKVARKQAENFSSLVNTDDLNSEAFVALVKDEILTDEGNMLCHTAHDIYRDWGLEFIIEQEYRKNGDLIALSKTYSSNHYMVYAFGQWLETLIDAGDDKAGDFIKAALEGVLPSRWEDKVMSVVLSSSYSDSFFDKYSNLLTVNDFNGLTKVLRSLIMSCQRVNYVRYKGKDVPLTTPFGRGWDRAVNLLYEQKEMYLRNHQGIVLDFLTAYTSHPKASSDAMRLAGLTTLYLFQLDEIPRERGDYFRIEKENDWASLVCGYSTYIKQELNTIIDNTVSGTYEDGDDVPYEDLLIYMIDNYHVYLQARLANAIPDGLFKLMDFFWFRRNEEKDRRIQRPYREPEYYLGISENLGPGMAFFPPSGLWGSTAALMTFHPEETVDYLIKFMNRCIDNYGQRSRDIEHKEETVIVVDGEENQVCCTQTLWNLYRGTSSYSMPHLLESIHMSFENGLFAMVKDEKPNEQTRLMLRKILKESHSCSLISVVASMVCAYPDELFEEALTLFGNYHFLILDDNRKLRERDALSIEFMYHRHIDMYHERERAKNRPHRSTSLADLFLKYQVLLADREDEESKAKFARLRNIVDKLKNEGEHLPDGHDMTIDGMILHVDYFAHKREEVTINGQEAIQMTPILPDVMKQINEERQNNFNNMMRGISLKNWVDSRYKRDYDRMATMPFDANPVLAYQEAKAIEEKLKDSPDEFYGLPGDEFVPNSVYATLLRDFKDKLDDTQYKHCKEYVLTALSQTSLMVSNSLSELGATLEALPVIIKNDSDKLQYLDLAISYLGMHYKYINERCSVLICKALHQANMWEEEPHFMRCLLEAFVMKVSEGTGIEDVPDEMADSILTLLPEGTEDEELRAIAKISIEKSSNLWKRRDRYHLIARRDELYDVAHHIADYVIKARKDECQLLLRPFIPYTTDDDAMEILFSAVLIEVVVRQEYKNFWQIWDMFYTPLVNQDVAMHHSDSLNNYLLNPGWVNDQYGEWFAIDDHYFAFFKRVIGDIGHCPIVLYILARHWYVMGRKYDFEYLAMMGEIALCHPDMDMKDYQEACVTYLGQFLKALSNKSYQIKPSAEKMKHADALIAFMEKNNSTIATQLRPQIIG